MLVGDYEFGVELLAFSEAVAGGAGALRGVEGEEARFDLRDGEARDGAGEFFAEDYAVGGDFGALEIPLPPAGGGTAPSARSI